MGLTVADLGFPRGGTNLGGNSNLLFAKIKNCIKIKEIGQIKGGSPNAHLGSPIDVFLNYGLNNFVLHWQRDIFSMRFSSVSSRKHTQ